MEGKLFLDRREIQKIVKNIGSKINKAISKSRTEEPIVLLGIMDGAVMFMCDVAKEIKHPTVMLFTKCHSYKGTTQGGLEFDYWPDFDFSGKHIIIIDEIVDSGNTIRGVMQKIVKNHEPHTIDVCSLIKRKGCPCYVRFLGKQADQGLWLYGYGMDQGQEGMNRNLTNIYFNH